MANAPEKYAGGSNRGMEEGLILGDKQRVPAAHCAYCGQLNDAASGVEHNAKPQPGDAMVCLGCSGLNVYAEGGKLRRPTPEEVKRASKDLKLQMVRLAAFKLALERKKL